MRALADTDVVLYDEIDGEFEDEFDRMDFFDGIFNYNINPNMKYKTYVLCGTVYLWTGKHTGHYEEFFDNLKEAIIKCNDGFDGDIRVFENEEGKLFVEVAHHDNSNSNCLEIRELTEFGEELENNWSSVEDILNKEGATRNVEFTKRYMGVD